MIRHLGVDVLLEQLWHPRQRPLILVFVLLHGCVHARRVRVRARHAMYRSVICEISIELLLNCAIALPPTSRAPICLHLHA